MSSAERRRELNRLAAQKLRNRQKEKAVNVKQDYFAAQSRNTQLLYDVKQLRKMKVELSRQFEAHLPMCRHANVQETQNVDHPASQAVLSGTLSQYAVYTSGNQQFLSPVLLLSSDGSGTVPSTAVQLVTIAPSDVNFTDGVELNHRNGSVKQQSTEIATSKSRLTNGSTALDGDSQEKLVNGTCKSGFVAGDSVSEALLAAVDAHTQSRCATVVDSENSVGGISSVPASPITRPVHDTRRRRSMSSLPHSSEPTLAARKRSTARHMSSDQAVAKKAAAERDNLPLFLSAMTDDD